MSPIFLPLSPRFITFTLTVMAMILFGVWLYFDQRSIVLAILLGLSIFLTGVGIIDLFQKSHAVLRNYPIAAHLRFIFEAIRPEMRQYFFEGEKDGMPFSRDQRAIVYQRAKNALDVRPFGTNYDVYAPGYEWMNHSIAPTPVTREPLRITDRRPGLHAALLGLDLQHLGHELRLAQRQRHPRAERRRQARRLRARHRRRRLQPLSPRGRRRPHLGDRLGLLRLPQRRRHLLARAVRRGRQRTRRSRWSSSSSARAPSPAMAACCPRPRSATRSR